MGFIDSIPVEWRAFAKTCTDVSLIDDIPNTPKIEMGDGNLVPNLTSHLNKSLPYFWERSKFH